MIIQRTARITETGELILDSPLPKGLSGVEAEVTISLPAEETDAAWDDQPWTDEEIKELLRSEPLTGAEIAKSDAIGAWADYGITDSVAWIEEQRRKRRERREW